MRKGKREKVIKSKRWGSEWTREEQRRKGGTPAPRGVTTSLARGTSCLCGNASTTSSHSSLSKAWRTGCPVYIASLLNEHRPTRTLRSSDELLFTIPFCSLSLGFRAFSINAPRIWNNQTHDCRANSSIACCKCNLKTELFNVVYPI